MILITERYASVTIQVIRYCWEPFFYSFRARKNSGKGRRAHQLHGENFARNEKFFYLKEKTTANMGQKEEKAFCLRALSSSLYKYTTFFGNKQIVLTFEYNP